jgi:hypothetical protein
LRAQLDTSEIKVQRLLDSNEDMRSEISRLSVAVSKLVGENSHLRQQGQGQQQQQQQQQTNNGFDSRRNSPSGRQPGAAVSMYEHRNSNASSTTGSTMTTPQPTSSASYAHQQQQQQPARYTSASPRYGLRQ